MLGIVQSQREDRLADVLDFVEQYEVDRARGVSRTLAQWLARFPDSQAEIASEWLALEKGSEHDASTHNAEEESAQGRSDENPVSGRVYIGRYELVRELGRGGQGAVHLARDTRLNREVALKVLTGGSDSLRSSRIERLRREAEVIARLDHPSLCAILDADLTASPPWMAMRLVHGETLAAAITRAKLLGTTTVCGIALPPRTGAEVRALCALFERAARALHVAHESGIVHRDVKPGNMMVEGEGKPVLLDFGMAEDLSVEHQLTLQGDVFGTPDYMAPEQVDGRRSEVGPRTDVWALAASLYEALTLEKPFHRNSLPATFDAIRKGPTPLPSAKNDALGRDLDVIVATALEKDPARRYASALELAEDLRRFRAFEPILARPAGPMLRLARWARRNPTVATASIGSFTALSIGFLVSLHLLTKEQAALSNALGRHLAQRAIATLEEDGSRSLLLGAEAMERAPTWMTRGTLSRVLEANFLERRFDQPQPARLCKSVAVSPSAELLAMSFDDGVVRIVRLSDGSDVAQRSFSGEPRDLAFDGTGTRVCVALGTGLELCDVKNLATLASADLGVDVQQVGWGGERWIVAAGAWSALEKDTLADQGAVATLMGAARHIEVRPMHKADGSTSVRLLLLDDEAHVVALGADEHGLLASEELHRTPAGLTASLSYNGKTLVASTVEGDLQVISLAEGTGSLFGALRLDPPATTMEWSPDDMWVALGCSRSEDEGRAWALDPANLRLVPLPGHGGRAVHAVCPTHEGGQVWTAGRDLSMCLSDLATGKEIARSNVRVRAAELLPTPDGSRIVLRSKTTAGVQVLYSGSRPDALLLAGLRGAVRMAGFGPEGQTVHAIDSNGAVKVWNATNGRTLATVPSSAPLRLASYDTTKGKALVVDVQGRLAIIDLASGTTTWQAQWPSAIVAADLAKDGERVAIVDAQGAWLLTPKGERLALAVEGARGVCFDATGRRLVVLSSQDAASIHDAQDARRVGVCVWNSRGEAQGAELAVAYADGWAIYCSNLYLRPYDGEGREISKAIKLPGVGGLRVTTDQRLLPIGRVGTGLRLLQPKTGEAIWPRVTHNQPVVAADIDPAGHLMCAIATDNSLIISDMRDGSPWLERTLDGSSVTSCAMSKDGVRLLIGHSDGLVRVIACDPTPAALARLPRALDEWELQREQELAAPLEFQPLLPRPVRD